MDSKDTLQAYVREFPPIAERIPLVHVLPGVSLEKILAAGVINPTAGSRVNKITRGEGGPVDGQGKPVRADIAARLEGTDIAAELNMPMVHFSLGVPYYRPSFSTNKKEMGVPLYPCSLIFDGNDIAIDHIYGNDTGSFTLNFQHGHDAAPDRQADHAGNIPPNVRLHGMKLDSMETAHRYINALFGSADAYLHGVTHAAAPHDANPHAHFIYNMLKNPMTRPQDAKDASVCAEVKTARPVDVTKMKGMVIPASLLENPAVKQFLIDHPQVKCRCYDTTPWIDPDHYQVAMMQETYQLYRDMGLVHDVTIEDAPSVAARKALAGINAARAEKGGGRDRPARLQAGARRHACAACHETAQLMGSER